ncbi:MAG: NAD(P)/FAD-dependent oxidoreductase [Hyphomonadaceae bacterium]|nr:NAD(P)/FAD-dependent oxidoreductase [Hyphomonadaceae bacterium]
METVDAIVIGGGAAGLMCAATAGARGRRVVVLEHAEAIGKKILISGGGRCNFTNRDVAPERFVSANPDFARSALARFTPEDFLALVEKHRIPWYEKTLGQLFCEGAGSARRIVALLADECAAGGVDIRTGCAVTAIRRADRFTVDTSQGSFEAPCVVLATGGPSIPKLGATDFAYRLAAQFGLPIVEPAPALVPLTFAPADLDWMAPLSGVALDATAAAGGARFREAMLFTHRGLSGPAILQASTYWRRGAALTLDLAPGVDLAADLRVAKRTRPRAFLRTALASHVPQRFADHLAALFGTDAILAARRDADLDAIAAALHAFTLTPVGDEGWAKAEVARGGVDTRALSSRTLGARNVPGLFVIGEAVDVTGWLGGYNFQWAWASGRAAGEAL